MSSLSMQHERSSSSADLLWRLIPRLDGISREAVTVLDKQGCVRFLSVPMKRLLGYAREDFLGQSLFKYLQEQSKKAAEDAVSRMVQEGERFSQWRLCFESASGTKCWLEGNAANFLTDPRLGGIMIYWRELKA